MRILTYCRFYANIYILIAPKNKQESTPVMIEKEGPYESDSEQEPSSASIQRIVSDPDPETGEVFAETLYSDDVSPSDVEEDILTALASYDPSEFPDEIRADILSGRPFERTTIEIQSPHDKYIVDYIDVFALVKE